MSPKSTMFAGLLSFALLAGVADAKKDGAARAGRSSRASKAGASSRSSTVSKGDATSAAVTTKSSTYEAVRGEALPSGDLANLVEPLFAQCGQKEDHVRRQCEQIRDWSLQRLHAKKWVSLADTTSLQFQPYDSTEKTVSVNVTGCVSCVTPPVVAGSPRLIAIRAPRAMDEGAPVGLDLTSHDIPLETPKKAALWAAKTKPRLRVEFIYTVGDPFETKTQKGVTIVPVGHRIYNMCNGEVVASDPPSAGPVKIADRDPSCPAADAPTDEEIEIAKAQALLPETITRAEIDNLMKPVRSRVHECGEEFELKQGVARVKLELTGEGKRTTAIEAPYDKGDVHLCIRAALNDVVFPKFRSASPPVKIDYAFVLRK